MDIKRMAELSGIPGMVDLVEGRALTESEEPISVKRFPEVVQVTNFLPGDTEKTLSDIPLPSLTTNIDRAAFRLGNLGVLVLDAQGAAWHIYLTPVATDAQVDAAIEMARTALIPDQARPRADRLSGYRPQQPMESVDRKIK